MEWKPSYGVFMDESYKLTYPDGKCNLKKAHLFRRKWTKGTIITCCNKKATYKERKRKKIVHKDWKWLLNIISRVG